MYPYRTARRCILLYCIAVAFCPTVSAGAGEARPPDPPDFNQLKKTVAELIETGLPGVKVTMMRCYAIPRRANGPSGAGCDTRIAGIGAARLLEFYNRCAVGDARLSLEYFRIAASRGKKGLYDCILKFDATVGTAGTNHESRRRAPFPARIPPKYFRLFGSDRHITVTGMVIGGGTMRIEGRTDVENTARKLRDSIIREFRVDDAFVRFPGAAAARGPRFFVLTARKEGLLTAEDGTDIAFEKNIPIVIGSLGLADRLISTRMGYERINEECSLRSYDLTFEDMDLGSIIGLVSASGPSMKDLRPGALDIKRDSREKARAGEFSVKMHFIALPRRKALPTQCENALRGRILDGGPITIGIIEKVLASREEIIVEEAHIGTDRLVLSGRAAGKGQILRLVEALNRGVPPWEAALRVRRLFHGAQSEKSMPFMLEMSPFFAR